MKKIFIFDAHPSIRQLLAEELTAEGNVTMSVGKPESVLDCIQNFIPDLIVLDLYAQGAILWGLFEELKRIYPGVPILLFTMFSPKESPSLNKADAWVKKSFLFNELKEKIAALLETKRGKGKIKGPTLANDLNQSRFPAPPWPAALRLAH